MRAISAGVAAERTVLYAYALTSGIKELSTAAPLASVVAVLAASPPRQVAVSELAPGAVVLAAVFASFSLGALPWLGMALFVLFVVDLAARGVRKRALGRWAVLGVGTLIVASPTVAAAVKLAPLAAT